MQDSMQLFETIANNSYFVSSAIMLFFNKKDLYEVKIKKSPLKICFPQYTGENTYEETTAYIKKMFENLNNSPASKQFYFHYTCATSTENMKFVFDSVTDSIIERNLKACGMSY